MKTILTIYNLSVKLETTDIRLQNHINNFIDKFYTVKQKSFVGKHNEVSKVFVSKIQNSPIYFLHSTQFVHLYQYLKDIGYPINITEKIDARDYFILPANFSIRPNWKLREEQIPVYEFLINNPYKSKLIPLATGSGKTLISLMAIGHLNKRLGIVILPTFIPKWVEDITSIHNAVYKDIMVIQGYKALSALIEQAKNNELVHNYYIFSNRTMQEYITAYEENPDSCVDLYGCSPIDLFPLLGIGIFLIDEVHMSFHAVYKILLHTNVEYQIGLSATLLAEDKVTKKMHKIVYPEDSIYGNNLLKKYIDVYSIAYNISESLLKFIKTTNYGSTNYSHIAFEQSILRKDFLLKKYMILINSILEDYYIEDYMENDKVIIFVSTVRLATELVNFLQNKYPNTIVKRYCEDDPYENLTTGEIIVSTVISAGTGVDIPNLRVCIQTVSISSSVSNIQSMGRLRKLKDRDVKFCYIYANNIAKQKMYHIKRLELFRDRVATINYRQSRFGLS